MSRIGRAPWFCRRRSDGRCGRRVASIVAAAVHSFALFCCRLDVCRLRCRFFSTVPVCRHGERQCGGCAQGHLDRALPALWLGAISGSRAGGPGWVLDFRHPVRRHFRGDRGLLSGRWRRSPEHCVPCLLTSRHEATGSARPLAHHCARPAIRSRRCRGGDRAGGHGFHDDGRAACHARG